MTKPPNTQSWDESLQIGKDAVQAVSEFLNSSTAKENWLNTYLIHNVEEDSRYQGIDIDLLWVVPVGDFLRCNTIEVKGDRYHETGNFFFETVSVEHRGKPGAFIISRAEWFFYYFLLVGELYCLPMEQLRPWFKSNESRFPEKRSHSVNKSKNSRWSTLGKLVPIKVVISEIEGVRRFCKAKGQWKVV